MVTMMVGYAIFSETITINGTATAKGDFSFEITTQKEVLEDIKTGNMYAIYTDYGTPADTMTFETSSQNVESSITNTSNTVTYSASFKYPGQKQFFTIKVTNTGSIPITFDLWDEIEIETSSTGNLIMDDGGLFDINKLENATLGGDNPYGFRVIDEAQISQIMACLTNFKEVFVPKRIFDELELDPYAIPILETGESIYFLFESTWRDLDINPRIKGLDVVGVSTINIPIKQYTN